MTPSAAELRDEQRRLRVVRFTADLATQVIMQGGLGRDEAQARTA